MKINITIFNNKKLYPLIILFLCISVSAFSQKYKKIIILHTNDMHSQVEKNDERHGRYMAGKGGMVRISTYMNHEKAKSPDNTIILDAGDFCTGSVYSNIYKGEVEIEMMNTMGYDASTFGNHEFDAGPENLAKLVKEAHFPFINCNYDFTGSCLNGLTKPYIILYRDGVKIGIFGLGTPQLVNMTFPRNIKGIVFNDTYRCANETANMLRNEEKCDLIICLSHIGWKDAEVCDSLLAMRSHNIDVIIGGHSHTYMEQPKKIANLDGKIVYVNQTGANTLNVGRMEITLKKQHFLFNNRKYQKYHVEN